MAYRMFFFALLAIAGLPYLINAFITVNRQQFDPEAMVLDCDGSFGITRMCDDFCKYIQAYEGYCNLDQKTCFCVWSEFGLQRDGLLAPVASSVPTTTTTRFPTTTPEPTHYRNRNPIAPAPSSGIYEIPAPDLSQLRPFSETQSSISTGGSTSTTEPGLVVSANISTMNGRRKRRGAFSKRVRGGASRSG